MKSIVLTKVSKNFKLRKEIKEQSNILLKESTIEEFIAVKDVTLEIKQGEALGIIGKNGCGKTTLLKLIAGILKPTSGKIEITGKVMSFIELGIGLQPDLTGRDNIYLYASLLGIPRRELEHKMQWLIDFSGLKEFIDAKFRTYSSGMQVRLAFSIAMVHNPDILLIDEILAVGDASFQEKSFNKIRLLKQKGKTIVLVSHDLHQIKRICDRVVFMDEGNVISIGKPEEVIARYLRKVLQHDKSNTEQTLIEQEKNIAVKKKELEIEKKKSRGLFSRNLTPVIEEELEDKTLNYLESLENYKRILSLELVEEENTGDAEKIISQLEKLRLIILRQEQMDPSSRTDEIKGIIHRQANIVAGLNAYSKYVDIYHAWRDILTVQIKQVQSDVKRSQVLQELLTVAFYCSKAKDIVGVESIVKVFIQCKGKIEGSVYDVYLTEIQQIVSSLPLKKDRELIQSLFEEKIKINKTNKKIAEILSVKLFNSKYQEKDSFQVGSECIMRIECMAFEKIRDPSIGMGIFDKKGNFLFGPNTYTSKYFIKEIRGRGAIECRIKNLWLLPGVYTLSFSLTSALEKMTYDYWDKKIPITITGAIEQRYGSLYLPHEWKILE